MVDPGSVVADPQCGGGDEVVIESIENVQDVSLLFS